MSLDSWMWCKMVSRSLACLCCFMAALGVEEAIPYFLFLIHYSALALPVAKGVCPFLKAAVDPASSTLFMVLFMLVPPGFLVVILLD